MATNSISSFLVVICCLVIVRWEFTVAFHVTNSIESTTLKYSSMPNLLHRSIMNRKWGKQIKDRSILSMLSASVITLLPTTVLKATSQNKEQEDIIDNHRKNDIKKKKSEPKLFSQKEVCVLFNFID